MLLHAGELEAAPRSRASRWPAEWLRRSLSTQCTAQVEAYRAEGREPVLRFRMPDRAISVQDLVRGWITIEADNVFDYVIVRANGQPLYPLVNPVDDALMGITHVLRGEDLLPSTPRQIALHEALREIGVADGPLPRFGHLPFVMGEGNRKLSKRDPQSSLQHYRDRGFVPEGLLNYLALLGWSIGEDREIFTWRRWRRRSTSPGSTPTRLGSTRRRPRRSTACGCADAGRGASPPDGAVPAVGRNVAAVAVGGPTQGSAGRHAAGPGAHVGAGRGGGDARLPVRRRPCALAGRLTPTAIQDLEARAPWPPLETRWPALARVDDRVDRGGLAVRAGRRVGPEAEARLRAGAHRGDGAAGVTAAVRVDGLLGRERTLARLDAALALPVDSPTDARRPGVRRLGRGSAAILTARSCARGVRSVGVWCNWQHD